MYSELPDHIHSSLVEQIFLDLWSKPGMIALIKEGKKKKKHPFLIPRHQGCEVLKNPLTSSSVEAQMAGSSIRSQVGITQFFEVWGMHYYYHTWPKDTVLLSGLLHATHTSGGAFFFFRCCCSSSSLFLRVLGLPCSLFRSWQFQFLEWFTFHR